MSEEELNNESEQSYGGGRRYISRPKICQFCADKNIEIDYKQYDLLRRFVTEEGKIRPRRQTGTCARHQRELARAVKRARHIALLPFTGENRNDYR
jgi:small subunit ribosomal protein S18